MDTNMTQNSDDIKDMNDMNDETVEQIINKFIEIKDEKSEEIMSECSQRAQQIRDKINEILETRETVVDNDGDHNVQQNSRIDAKSLLNLQKELEIEISGINLNNSPKVVSNEDKTNDSKVSNTENSINTNLNDNKNESNKSLINNKVDNNVCNQLKTIDNNLNENKKITERESSSPVNKVETNVKNNSSRKQTKSVSKKSEYKEKVTNEQLNKKLSTFNSDSERIAYLSNSYVELFEENRNLIQVSKQSDKMNHHLSREKDQMQSEHNRIVLAKCRLESLCRELQRQNRIIKEESLLKIKEEEEKRRQIANKFQGTLNEIMQLIQENQKRNTQLKEENADLAQKLKTLMGHYECWEKHTEKIIKQKDLETQLVKAKYAKTNLILNQEKEIFLKEKQQLIQMIADLQKRCSDMSTSELKLRTELNVYTTKYDEFQGVLSKSNDMFAGFKKDMEKMSKQIKKLEKETAVWKTKWESSNKSLIILTEEKQKRDTEHLSALQKIATLEKLCRALQEERALMQNMSKNETPNETQNVESKVESVPNGEL